jgi:WD40 repeat protein
MVHDAKRGRLYISTRGHTGDGQVLSYQLATRQFDPPLVTGGTFAGIELSPDEDTLAVADATQSGPKTIVVIDLRTRVASRLTGPDDGGTFSVAFTSNTEVLVSAAAFAGSTPIRRIDLTTRHIDFLPNGTPASMLCRSADGSTIAFGDSAISPPTWGRYEIADRSVTVHRDDPQAYEIAIDRLGAQFAIPTYDGLQIFDRDFERLKMLGSHARALPVGAVYSPVDDEIYLAWADAPTSLDAYSSRTLEKLRDIAPIGGMFYWSGNNDPIGPSAGHAFNNGRLRISRDGTQIFATLPPSSIAVYSTGL